MLFPWVSWRLLTSFCWKSDAELADTSKRFLVLTCPYSCLNLAHIAKPGNYCGPESCNEEGVKKEGGCRRGRRRHEEQRDKNPLQKLPTQSETKFLILLSEGC